MLEIIKQPTMGEAEFLASNAQSNLMEIVPKLMEESDTLINQFIGKYSHPSVELLYHYTTPAGLKGIISENCLWATHTSFLNDLTEGKYGRELIIETLKNEAGEGKEKGFLNTALKMFDPGDSFRPFVSEVEEYVSCFCENGDLLSQWRGYTDNAGYSIGFLPEKLKELSVKQGDKTVVCLGKVVYDKEKQKDCILEIIDILQKKDEWPDAGKALVAYAVLKVVSCFFKDECFKEEQEWRAINEIINFKSGTRWGGDCIDFRCNNETIIPFTKLMIPAQKLPIKKVITGPAVKHDRAKIAIEKMLEEKGFEVSKYHGHLSIKKS